MVSAHGSACAVLSSRGPLFACSRITRVKTELELSSVGLTLPLMISITSG